MNTGPLFSIYDYRTELYKQSLLLFDKIVVPVPIRPFHSVTEEDIVALRSELAFLEKEGAAEAVEWDPDEFAQWRHRADGAEAGQQQALARRLMGDPPFQTRLILKENTDERGSRTFGAFWCVLVRFNAKSPTESTTCVAVESDPGSRRTTFCKCLSRNKKSAAGAPKCTESPRTPSRTSSSAAGLAAVSPDTAGARQRLERSAWSWRPRELRR